jgi:hypothetical protein
MKEIECGIRGRKVTAEKYNASRKTFPDGKSATTISTRLYKKRRRIIIEFNVGI